MNSRFLQSITTGVLAGGIALAGCASSGSDKDPETPQDGNEPAGPALESAFALNGEFALERQYTVVLTFSEEVEVTDAEEAAGGFTLAENVAAETTVGPFTLRGCDTAGSYGITPTTQMVSGAYRVAPFYACSTATGAALDVCTTGERNTTFLSEREKTLVAPSGDAHVLVLDYSGTGYPTNADWNSRKLRLRYTAPESEPIRNLDGVALASFDFPDHDDSGNVTYCTND